MSRNNNTPVVNNASSALNKFKMEIANELGINNYDSIDKGQLSSRQNGYVGGNMTKKMVAFAEQALASGQSSAISNSTSTNKIGSSSSSSSASNASNTSSYSSGY